MDFQTCAVEQAQIQFHEAEAAYVLGTLGSCPFGLLAYYVQSLRNTTTENNLVTYDMMKI